MPPPRVPAGRPSGPLPQAVALHQAGRLDEAAALYREVLAQAPRQFDALHLLGVVAMQQGRLDEAIRGIGEALAVQPNSGPALANLGTALMRAGRLDESRAALERAVRAQPGHAEAQASLGMLLRRLGRAADAVGPLRKAFAAQARSYDVAANLGAALLETGDARGALAAFEAAARLRPDDPAAWTNLAEAALRHGQGARALEAADAALRLRPDDGSALRMRGRGLDLLGRPAEARESFERAVRLAPRDAAAHNDLGAHLRDAGLADEAIASLRRALELDPALAAARQNLVAACIAAGRADQALAEGEALSRAAPGSAAALAALASARFEAGQVEAAIASWREAVAAPGADAEAWRGLANGLMADGAAAEAQKAYRQAVALAPENAAARWALAMSWLRPVYDTAGEMEDARKGFAKAVGELDAWFTPARAAAGGASAVGSTQPFYLAYLPVDARAALAPYGRLCARVMAQAAPPPAATSPVLAPPRARKLRVGLVSAQVRSHSVWNAITRGWVDHLDPARFQFHVFHLKPGGDAETERVRRAAFQFEDRPRTASDWARAIVDARCDLLLYPEIGMDPLTTRLASQRLAPVQAAAWGHPLTTGLPAMDLYLSAQDLEPADADAHYTERLVRLPGLGVHVSPLAPVAIPPDLAALGLPADQPLLLCPGTPFKYTPAHDAVWAAIGAGLQARGRGRLVFFRGPRAGMNERLERRLREAFRRAGADFDRTATIVPTLERGRFFGLMSRAALMLDTLEFSGFNTALQAIECGLPVVAFEGRSLRGRLASGPLRRLGLDEAVASTPDAFVATALRLVDDEPARLALRARLVERRGALFNDLAPVRALEQVIAEAVGRD